MSNAMNKDANEVVGFQINADGVYHRRVFATELEALEAAEALDLVDYRIVEAL